MSRAWVLMIAGPLVVACDPTEAPPDPYIEELPALTAEPGARLGSFDDPSTGFTRIGGVDVDRDGSVYVLEALVPEIRVYDGAGVVVRRIGQRGGGPGEFQGAPRFGVSGDTVWTVDQSGNRITLFDRRGGVLSTGRPEAVQVLLPSSRGFVLPWRMRPDGSFVSHMARVSSSRGDGDTGVRPSDRFPVPFVLFDASGAVIDTLGWADRPPPRMWRPPSQDDTRMEFIEVEGRRQAVPRPPTGLPWWEPVSDGYILIDAPNPSSPDGGALVVSRIGYSGDTVYSRTLRYTPAPYEGVALDTLAAKAARGEPGGMVPYSPTARGVPEGWQATAGAIRQAMEFPEFRRPIESPWVAQDEKVWLRRWDGVSSMAQWVILDAQGQPLGQLELPSAVRPRWSKGDIFWAVDPDEFDVPWLVRFQVQSNG